MAGLGWIDRGALVGRVTGLELRRARHAQTLLLRMQVRAHTSFFQAKCVIHDCSVLYILTVPYNLLSWCPQLQLHI